MNLQHRANGYLPAVCFNRSERILIDDSGYYYKTREGEVVGSFATEAAARYDMNKFLELIELEKEFLEMDFLMAA
jgi:hypothetical protein